MASVAPQATVISRSASSGRPQASACFAATASRSCGAPQVVAYWLKPSSSACFAASMISAEGGKSGKPWAKLTARSGPFNARLRRVISRMTLSVKLSALRLRIGAIS